MQNVALSVRGIFLDLDKDAIPVTFSVNDFGEIVTGTGDYSTDFDVPDTNTNRKALGYAEDINLSDFTRYSRQDAILVVGSLEAYGFVQVVSYDRRARRFSLAFFSGNADWFALANETRLRDLDFSEYLHLYTPAEIAANANNTTGFCYPIVDYGIQENNPYQAIGIGDIWPGVYDSAILRAGFAKIGYKYEAEKLENDPRFKRHIIPYSNEGAPVLLESFRERQFASASITDSLALVATYTEQEIPLSPIQSSPQLPSSATEYITQFAVRVRVIVQATLSASSATTRVFAKVNNSGDTPIVFLIDATGTGTTRDLVGEIELDLEVGDSLNIWFSVEPFINPVGDGSVSGTVSFEISGDILEGGPVDLAAMLPDISFADFMRDLTGQYNLLYQATQVTKTVKIFRFLDVLQNLNHSVDFTEKVDWGGQQKQDYERITQNLGTENFFAYGDGGEDSELEAYENETGLTYGNGMISLDNQFLDPEAEAVSLEVSPTINRLSFSGKGYVPFIPIFTLDNDGEREDNDPGYRSLLVAVNTPISDFFEDGSLNIEGETGTENLTAAPFAWFWKTPRGNGLDALRFSLAFQKPELALGDDSGLIADYYQSFRNLFARPVLVELDARLNAVDINNLDFSRPVFIGSPFNSYFFLNRVVEFVGQETTCGLELLKIA